MAVISPSVPTPTVRRLLPEPAPLALTSALAFMALLLVRSGTRAAHEVRSMRARGREVTPLRHDLDIPGRDPVRRLAVLGDSAAAGHGLADPDDALARRVGRALAAVDGRATRVRCAAVDGADTACVLRQQVGTAKDAEVVLLGVGVNDATHRHGLRRVARDTAELLDAISQVAAPSATVVLLTCPDISVAPGLPAILRPPLGLWCRLTARTQAKVAATRNVVVLGTPRSALAPELFGSDGFHPGAVGHESMAAAVVEQLASG